MKSRVLEERDVLSVFAEAWSEKVQRVLESAGLSIGLDKSVDGTPLVSPELKVTHKKSGLRYTVDSVSPRDVILRTPEGEKLLVDGEEFESDYEVS